MTDIRPTRLLAGEIGKPHGISGEVYVVPISDDPCRFEAGSTLLRDAGPLVVESSRQHGNRLLVKFEGVQTRDQAEALRGPLFIAAEEARALEEDEYRPHDLVGCEVRTVGHGPQGEVREIVPGAAHDLLVIDTAKGERMIPLVKEIVVEVDVSARLILVDPPAGLLD